LFLKKIKKSQSPTPVLKLRCLASTCFVLKTKI
jgi:hypothetical protein